MNGEGTREGEEKETRHGFTDRQRLAAERTGSRPASQPSLAASVLPGSLPLPMYICIVVLYICSVHIIRAGSSVCALVGVPRPCRYTIRSGVRANTGARVCMHERGAHTPSPSSCMCAERRRRHRRRWRQKCIALLHQTVLNRTNFSLSFAFILFLLFFLPFAHFLTSCRPACKSHR